jgi:choline-sulfatase
MTRRTFVQMPALAAAQAQTQSPSAPARTLPLSERPPNILFILVDQMTPFMLGPYGQKAAITPNLDRLAREGVTFDRAYCNSPLCVPSRMSMFTGRQNSAIDVWDNASELRSEFPTMMHFLRHAGYQTAVSGKTHFIGPDQLHGFHERMTPCIYPTHFAFLHPWKKGPYYIAGTSIQTGLGRLGPVENDGQISFDDMTFGRGIERLRSHALTARDQPLFLNISFTQPHDPYCAPKKYLDLYRNANISAPRPYGDIRKLSPTYEWIRIVHGLDKETLTPEKIRLARMCYLAACTWLDEKVGAILDELEKLGLADNTLVVFTSDHGDMLGEKGQWFKRLYFEWSARIPLILRLPGKARAGMRVSSLVSLVDLLPTFAEAAGVAVETPLDGKSLIPLLDGREDGAAREVIGEYGGEATIEPIRMVRRDHYKYIAVNGYPPQLYDLKKDPDETVNVAGQAAYAAVERELRARAEQGWNGAAMKSRIMASQENRDYLRSIAGYMSPGLWPSTAVSPPLPDDYGWK